MLTWMSIGIASLRFRGALAAQGKTHLLPFKNWTYPWGPWFVVVANIFLILVQGWSCFSPSFDVVSFLSFYLELPLMLIMFVAWKFLKRTKLVKLEGMDLETDIHTVDLAEEPKQDMREKLKSAATWLF